MPRVFVDNVVKQIAQTLNNFPADLLFLDVGQQMLEAELKQ